jgi:hypothetical protein
VRVRDHVAVSTVAALLFAPRQREAALGLWAGGVLIDVDHYLWYAVHERRLNPAAAVRFFNDADAPRDSETRFLHSPIVLFVVLLACLRWSRFFPVLVGMVAHVGLDAFHETRMGAARRACLERDGHSCRECGAASDDVRTHTVHQPTLLPSYRVESLITLCASCHELAHRAVSSR